MGAAAKTHRGYGMKRFEIVAGAVASVAAMAGAAGLVVGGALPSNAARRRSLLSATARQR